MRAGASRLSSERVQRRIVPAGAIVLNFPPAPFVRTIGSTLALRATYALPPGETFTRIDFVVDPGGSEVIIATDAAPEFSQTYLLDGVAVAEGSHTLVARLVTSGGSYDSYAVAFELYSAMSSAAATLASGSDWASGTLWNSLLTSAQLDAGDMAIVGIALDNVDSANGESSNVASVTIGGIAVTRICEFTGSLGTPLDGATLWIGAIRHTANIPVSSVVAVTTNSAVKAKAMVANIFNGDADSVMAADGDIQTEYTAGGVQIGPLSMDASTSDQHLFFRFVARGRTGAAIQSGSAGWTLTTAVQSGTVPADEHVAIRGEFKLAIGTASGTSDPDAVDSTGVHVSALVPFRQVAP